MTSANSEEELIYRFHSWLYEDANSSEILIEKADPDFIELGAALAQGFAIQTFFIPILKQNPNRRLYKKLLLITYVIGIAVYSYIGYSGSQSKDTLT